MVRNNSPRKHAACLSSCRDCTQEQQFASWCVLAWTSITWNPVMQGKSLDARMRGFHGLGLHCYCDSEGCSLTSRYCPRRNYYWINFTKDWSRKTLKTFFTGTNSFKNASSNLCCKKSTAWKLLETIINSSQGLSRNKISIFQKLNPLKKFFQIRYDFGPDSTACIACWESRAPLAMAS